MTNQKIDPLEAPDGFIAVLRDSLINPIGPSANCSKCMICDWRSECLNPNKDRYNHKHLCMRREFTNPKTNQKVKRLDGCDVIFKKPT